ncbi:MAG: metallophosphoesterase [Chloroflexi bacterium]|nr:metallophosphoesterase [Chloroflexota bacterium]MCY3588926.1 metallophosphoesterase [Chloroflexota bacterium]MCY3685806.1 metallophosphoesterase [Chloroflexota bacterium]MDE2709210.1 metallophosphoesterase [Chloroflexota bacterium]
MDLRRLAMWLGAIGAGSALYAWWESTAVEVREHRLSVADLPPGLDGLRILHMSDTHFPANGDSIGRFLEQVWPLDYDLVCCTGDFVETSAGWDSAADALTQLEAPFGVFATLGAHDYCQPVRSLDEWASFNVDRLKGSPRRFVNPQPFVERLEAAGIVVLRNEWRSLEIGGELVRIGGAGDDSVGMAQLESAVPPAGGFSMLLTHSPDAALRMPLWADGGPSVVLSGHTHGGQIRVPGWGAPLRHSRLVNRTQADGVFDVRGAQVVVSRGFGTAHVPLRFACRPEIGLIHLSKAPG